MKNEEDGSNFLTGKSIYTLERVSVRALFMISTLVGSLALIVGVFANSRMASIVLPTIVMFVYIYLTSKKSTAKDIPMSRIGDSYYFLGFTLTLVSLVASLSLISSDNINLESIISTFGAALVTTIVGLIARLSFTTLANSHETNRERLDEEIERSMSKFSSQLERLVQDVNTAVTTVNTQFQEVQLKVVDQYKSGMGKGLEEYQDSVNSLSKRLDGIEVSSDLVMKPMNKALNELIQTVTEYKGVYTETNKDLANANKELVSNLSGAASYVEKHIEAVNSSLDKIVEIQAEKFSNALQEIGDAILTNLGDIKDIKSEVASHIEAEIRTLSNQLDDISKISASTSVALEKITHALGDANELLHESTEKVNKLVVDTSKIHLPFEQSAAQLRTSVESFTELSSSIVKLTDITEKYSAASDTAINKVIASSEDVQTISKLVSEDVTKVYDQLSDVIKKLDK
jgi:methyl-accepting chemotaxis protein